MSVGTARSNLFDERLARLVLRLAGQNDSSTVSPQPPSAAEVAARDATYDWAGLYAGVSPREEVPPFLGALSVKELPARGLGFVAARDIEPGELLLVEECWALSPLQPEQPAGEGLLDACLAKLRDVAVDDEEKAVVICMHGSSRSAAAIEGSIDDRVSVFRRYVSRVQDLSNGSHPTPNAKPTKQGIQMSSDQDSRSNLAGVLASNARKTESWDPHTLLLDESGARGGLWLLSSLFNHSCQGNVALSYCHAPDSSPLLVARAASPLGRGAELCHSYVYPFETVGERRARLQRAYGFQCACDRCVVEAPLADQAVTLADSLELGVAAFTEARRTGKRSTMTAAASRLRSGLADVDREAAAKLGESQRALWRAQFVWGDHALAMASEAASSPGDAAEAFSRCVTLTAAAAPGTGYDLKYRAMLAQCLARRVLAGGCGVPISSLREPLESALRDLQATHGRIYGGGSRHFSTRMRKRLDEVYAALALSAR